MAQKYKIFLNEKLLLLEHSKDSIKRENFRLISSPEELKTEVHILENSKDVDEITVFSSINVDELIKNSFRIVKAAGGLVFRDPGDLLFIKRFEKWDLPKGKLHKSESTRLGGIREVTEETGLTNLRITEKIANTYHIFKHKGRYNLKETTWYSMYYDGNETPVPQLEENITEVQWFSPQLIPETILQTYKSLQGMIIDFLEKKEKSGLTAWYKQFPGK